MLRLEIGLCLLLIEEFNRFGFDVDFVSGDIIKFVGIDIACEFLLFFGGCGGVLSYFCLLFVIVDNGCCFFFLLRRYVI